MAHKWLSHSFKDIPMSEKRITISTMFTLLRIVLVPFIVGSMLTGWWGYALVLFVVASMSDIIDGYLARYLNEQTFLGACLDPIADKLLVVSCFFTLAFVQSPLFLIPQRFVFFVLIKEAVVLGGAVIVYLFKGTIQIRPTLLGKLAAVLQMLFITWLLACYFFNTVSTTIYYGMFGIVTGVITAVLIQYVYIGWRQLTKNGAKNE